MFKSNPRKERRNERTRKERRKKSFCLLFVFIIFSFHITIKTSVNQKDFLISLSGTLGCSVSTCQDNKHISGFSLEFCYTITRCGDLNEKCPT